MQKCCTNASGVLKASVVIVLATAILHLIGFSTPFWSERLNSNEGPWEVCRNGICRNSASDPISRESFYEATQAFAILSLLFAVATIVLLFVAACVPTLSRNKPLLLSAIVVSSLTVIFIIVALTVYGVRGKVFLEAAFGDPFVLGFSFILFAISLFGYLFVALFVAMDLNRIIMMEREAEEKMSGDAEEGTTTAPENTSENTPENASENTSENASENTSENASENTSENASENTSEPTSESPVNSTVISSETPSELTT